MMAAAAAAVAAAAAAAAAAVAVAAAAAAAVAAALQGERELDRRDEVVRRHGNLERGQLDPVWELAGQRVDGRHEWGGGSARLLLKEEVGRWRGLISGMIKLGGENDVGEGLPGRGTTADEGFHQLLRHLRIVKLEGLRGWGRCRLV